jgi:ABC-2 type transport system permease protein
MGKTLILIQREYLQRAHTRWFLLSTIGTPLMLLALSYLPFLAGGAGSGARRVTVLDQSGDPALFEVVQRRLAAGAPSSGDDMGDVDPALASILSTPFELTRVAVAPGEDIDQFRRGYNAEVEKDATRAYVVLRPGVLDGAQPEFYASNVSDLSVRQLGLGIGAAIAERRLVARAGFDSAEADRYLKNVSMKIVKLDSKGETRGGGQALVVALVMFFSMFMTIYLYGQAVMHGVIEEKQSRIVEVMLSSVSPFQIMISKIVGIGLVGLTQFVIWVVSFTALTTFGLAMSGKSASRLQGLPAPVLVCFVLYFVLGYFLFATLYAMVGAIVSRPGDAQQLQYPVSILLAVPATMFWMIMRDPNSTRTTVLSMVPFFAPTMMMQRMAVVEPPLWQIVLSMLLMCLTIFAGMWVAAKIHRVTILMSGKRPSLTEVGRWLRYK